LINVKLMNEFKIIKVWSCSKKDERFVIGFVCAYLAQCEDGRWLAIFSETAFGKPEVVILKNRTSATKQLRERGFMNRVSKIYPNVMKGVCPV